MEIRVLGCSGGKLPGYYLTSFLIDGELLVDAGSVSSVLSLEEQRQIDVVLVSHAHLDHVGELFFLAGYRRGGGSASLDVYSIPEVLEIVGEHLLNDKVWPDMRQPSLSRTPLIRLRPLDEMRWNGVGRFSVLPLRTNHPTPTAAYVVSDGETAVFFSSDTGSTDTMWQPVKEVTQLRGVIVEVSFPDEMREIAKECGHLTPETLAKEMEKLGRPDVPIFVSHVKPRYDREIREQVSALGFSNLTFLEQGKSYQL